MKKKRSPQSMRLLLSIPLFGVFIALSAALTSKGAQAATLVVDDDGQATALNCDASGAAFSTIQSAVNAAASGDTIQICPGTYDEQLVVTKSSLTIRGAGAELTVVRPTVVNQNSTNMFGNPVAPIVLVDGTADLILANLTLDGSSADSGATIVPPCPVLPFYVGVFYRNSSATFHTAHITGITSTTSCAFAIRAEGSQIVVKKSLLDHYGVSAIACAGSDTRCTVTGNTIRGQGPVNNQTQAGIQIRSRAAGKISGNVISDHVFIGAKGVPQSSVGIFLVYATPSSNPDLIQENVFVNNQVNVQRIGSAAAF
jgi:hypothetical protein